jgi:hypothetical protein
MEARLSPRRLLTCATALVLLAVLTSGCGGGGNARAAAKDPPLVKYSKSFLSFTHPAAWRAYSPRTHELHFNPLVYLSTQPVHDPCSTSGNTTTCGFPVTELQPGGVLVTWQYGSPPAFTLGSGTQMRVGGRPASLADTAGGICRRIGADRTIDVRIAVQPLPSVPVEFTACLRSPGLGQEKSAVDALLASTQFDLSQ